MKTYFSLLDAVRFFAAFWVMNFHYLFVLGLSSDLHWYRYGNLGVQLFFIISGFVIVQSLKGKSLKEFAIGRFIRLYPLFWILCTLTYLLTLSIPGAHHLHFTEYLRSMTMLGDIFDGITGPGSLIDPSYWTLTVELIFYSAIGLFTYLFSYKNIRYFLIVWFAFSIFAFAFHVDEDFYVKLALVRHASYFIFGCSLALIVAREARGLLEKYIDWGLLFMSAFFSVYMHPRAVPLHVTPNPLDNSIVTILLIIFFFTIPLLVYLSKYVKSTRVIYALTILGGLTYPLYLLHQRIGNVLINYGTNTYDISWNTLAICFELFIIATAYLLYVQDKKIRSWLAQKLLRTT